MPKPSRSGQPKTPSSPASTDLLSLVGHPTSSLLSTNPMSVARTSSVFLMAASCGLFRVIVPPQGQQPLLEELQNSHLGASKMMALACSYIWWSRMDTEIDNLVKSCSVCQQSCLAPAVAPLRSWEWSSKLWSRLHLDFAGPFMGHMFLILVDAHSKWLDVHLMLSISSANTIEKLCMEFATHGLPWKVVTNSGSSFTSEEFRVLMSSVLLCPRMALPLSLHLPTTPQVMAWPKERCKLSNMDLKQQRKTHYKSDSLSSSLPTASPLTRPWALPQLNY